MQKLVPNHKELSLFPKYAFSEGIVVKIIYYSEVISEYAKNLGFGKGEIWNLGSLIVPLMCK